MDGSAITPGGDSKPLLVSAAQAARIAAALQSPLAVKVRHEALAQALDIAERSNPDGPDIAEMIREDRERDYYNDHLYPWD